MIIISLFCSTLLVESQLSSNPNFGLKSHETLSIESIETTAGRTYVNLILENKSLDGTFCADKNIYLILPNTDTLKIIKAEGIPVCPDSYHFTIFGEKLKFTLIFPAVPFKTDWVDLIEDCSEACFSFKTVILNAEINDYINHAYDLISGGRYSECVDEYEKILDLIKSRKIPLEGNIFMNLIYSLVKTGNIEKAKFYYQNLQDLDTTESVRYLKILNASGISL